MSDVKENLLLQTASILDTYYFRIVKDPTGTPSSESPLGSVVRTWVGDPYNHLINGGFDFAQRQTPATLTTIAQDAYSADRWRVSRENTSVQYQRADGLGETGITSRYFGTFKKITSAGKLMAYQIIEGSNSISMRGKTAVFQIRMKASASKTIRMAVIQLQNAGTIDTIPGTFVTAYGANTVDPTLGANLAIITAAQSKSVTTAWANFSVKVTVPSNSKNLICAVWTDSQFAVNDTLSVDEAGFYTIGDGVVAWNPRAFTEELLLCQRYYYKTFELDTGPVENAGTTTGEHHFPAPLAGATIQRGTALNYPTVMFASPVVTFFNPAAANAQVRDVTAGVDCSSNTAVGDSRRLVFSCTGNAATAAGNALRAHITAEAEL